MKAKLIFLAFLLLSFFAEATHILGGFATYEYLGNNEFLFEMWLYRDCDNGEADFDDPAFITIYRESGINYYTIFDLSIPVFEINDNISVSPDDCMNVSYPFCIQEGVYIFRTILPQLPQNECFHIIYQRH